MRIPEVSFSKSFRGFNTQEVKDYVQSVAYFEEEMLRQQVLLTEKVQSLENEVNRLREVESSLFRAMKLAEEAQKSWQDKVEKEATKVIEGAKKQAEALLASAEKDSQKAKLLIENERRQLIGQVEQEGKEQTRELRRLESVQAEIANQLEKFAQQTLSSVEAWSRPKEESSVSVKAEKARGEVPAKQAKKSVDVPKPVKKAKKTPPKKGNNLDVATIEDDGLPTLNKVLEAYAKNTGPRGKVGEIN